MTNPFRANVCKVRHGYQGRVRRWLGRDDRGRALTEMYATRYFAASKHGGLRKSRAAAHRWAEHVAITANRRPTRSPRSN